MNQANFLFGYKVRTTIIVLVTTKEKIIVYQLNWMLVFRLQTSRKGDPLLLTSNCGLIIGSYKCWHSINVMSSTCTYKEITVWENPMALFSVILDILHLRIKTKTKRFGTDFHLFQGRICWRNLKPSLSMKICIVY